MSPPTENSENNETNVGKQEFKKNRWSFVKNRSSFATVLSEESNTNEDWPEERPPNPYENASLLSKMFFVWPYQLMKKKKTGSKTADTAFDGILNASDLPDVLNTDSSGENLFNFNVMWMAEKRRAEEVMKGHKIKSSNNPSIAPKSAYPRLGPALIRDYIVSLWFLQPVMIVLSSAKLLQAVSLGKLIQSFQDGGSSSYLWAGLLVTSAAVVLMTNHQVYFFTWHKGMQTRIACIAAIYDKTLRLKSTSDSSSGNTINLATNDVDRFLNASAFGPYIVWGPLMLLLILVIGWLVIGWSFAVGIAVMIFGIAPLQLNLSKKFGGLRSKTARASDARVNAMSQAIEGIRVVKMMGYENIFQERITSCRKDEVDAIKRVYRYKAMSEALFFVTNIIVSVVIFLVTVGSGGTLSLVNVYTTLALVNTAQFEIALFSRAVAGLSECAVSVKRIQAFLESPEQVIQNVHDTFDIDSQIQIRVSNVTCHWNNTCVDLVPAIDENIVSENVALHNINIEFQKGELTCIIGEVGSGKSAFLSMLAGELQPSSGMVRFRADSTIAYASQEPFIIDASIRDNILFGKQFDACFYERVITACGLNADFAQLRDGEFSIAGDRGASLSGGQKARIGLARAFYQNSDCIFLDDPLSAVDSKVGHQLFYSAIQGLGLNRGKCVVLVTHQHQFIGGSRCVMMNGGHISCVGSYQQCVEKSDGKLTFAFQNKDTSNADISKEEASPATEDIIEEAKPETHADEDHKELSQFGSVKRATLLTYLRAMPFGLLTLLFVIMLCILTQSSVLGAIYVVGRWASLEAEDQKSFAVISIVLGLVFIVIILAVVRAYLLFSFTIESSKCLHDKMLGNVLRSKMSFFDLNNSGKIMNRFSSDVGSNDDILPNTLAECFVFSFIVLGALVATCYFLPLTLSICPPLLICFLFVRRIFVSTSRQLKRMEGVARSPIFSMMGESLHGIATMRANGSLEYFKEKFRSVHDAHGRVFFSFLACSRWLGFWTDALMVVFLGVASFVAVLICNQEWMKVDPSTLGIAFTLLTQSVYVFQWTVRQSAEAENQMVSVERVIEYCNLPSEAPLVEDDMDDLAESWPSEGNVDVQSLSVRYRSNLPLSLKELTFRIEGGSSVGVVGRTGSGKSTLVQSFLRLIESESGKIFVDGVDTSKLGLHKLRQSVSIIPQNPVLFGGRTIRENLDPFTNHDDGGIKEALLHANMLDAVLCQSQGLDTLVSDGGSNFSVGQRQLLCLARAILCRNKILVLDEPTANVDSHTDELLQKSVKENFDGATIIAIAHRIDTVIGYDKILVLGNGSVLEYGSPYELIQADGHFAGMIRDTGEEMSEFLISKAKISFGQELSRNELLG